MLAFDRDNFILPLEKVANEFLDSMWKDKDSFLGKLNNHQKYPKVNMAVENDYLVVKAAVPGASPEDITVEMTFPKDSKAAVLRLSGKISKEYTSPKDSLIFVKELSERIFTREFTLPEWVDSDPEASLKDGILQLKWKTPVDKVDERRVIPIKQE